MKVMLGFGITILLMVLLVIVLALIAGAVVTSPVWGIVAIVSILVNRNKEVIQEENIPQGRTEGNGILSLINKAYQDACNKKQSETAIS